MKEKLLLERVISFALTGKMKKVLGLVAFMLFIVSATFAQDLNVTGKVTGKDGSGIPGAAIVVKGTNNGTVTDMDGNFSLKIPENFNDSSVVISSIGYAKKEVKIAGQSTINILLEENTKQLKEVVVVGYGTQKRSDLTGAIASVGAKDIEKAPVLEVASAIQGRAAGVQVLPSSGSPGADVNIRVRGTASTGNSNPLYVIDGVPMGDFGLSSVNPSDIESIEVLKDASAAAIYGSRGANGVVLVTTKKGEAGKPVIKFDAYVGVQKMWKKMNLLSASEWGMLKNEAAIQDGKDVSPKFADYKSLGEGTDWQDQVFRTALMHSYNLSMSGGGEKNTYYISGNYFKQDGIINKTDAERMSIRFNGTQHLAPKLKTGQYMTLMRYKNNQIDENNEFTSVLNAALTMDPTTSVVNPDGTFTFSTNNNIKNPAALLDNTNRTWINNRLVGAYFGEYEFIEGLKFKSNLGLDMSFGNYTGFSPMFYINTDFQNSSASISRYSEQRLGTIWDNTISYSTTIKKNHEFSALAGISAQQNWKESLSASRSGIPSNDPTLRYLDVASSPIPSVGGNAEETALLSYIGRVNYVLMDKYLLTSNIRFDGSSRFVGNKRWGIFPSVSAGWKIHNEEFMKQFDMISTMKLRLGWGQLGNQILYGPDGAAPWSTVLTPGQNYTFGTGETVTSGSTQLSVGNPEIQWETVTQTNIGIDGGLWDDKLTFTIDYFDKKTSGMIVQKPIQAYLGIQNPPFVNAAEVLNRGLELGLNYKNKFKEIDYNAGFNMTFIHNEVLTLGGGNPITSADFAHLGNVSRTDVGLPIASFYGYQTDGIFQNETEVKNSAQYDPAKPDNVKPGDIRFKDIDGDGKITDKDRTFIGSAFPKFTYAINMGASYKGFDLSIFLQGTEGNKVFNGNKYYLESGQGITNMSNSMLGRWTGEGSTNEMARMTLEDKNNNRRISDRYVEDGSYLRIKTMQLGYTLPLNAVKLAKIQKLRLYVSAQNLLTFTSYSGLDPEIGVLGGTSGNSLDIGIDRGAYPQARTFTLGANFIF